MKGTDNSFNEKHPTLIGHCSNSVPHAANATHGKNKRVRSSWEIQGHIMSERKRRQEMAERFIQLSAMIPGLKKVSSCFFFNILYMHHSVFCRSKHGNTKYRLNMRFIILTFYNG